MKYPKKEPKSLADISEDDIELANSMAKEGFWCCEDDEYNSGSSVNAEWARALKDLEELGFNDEIE